MTAKTMSQLGPVFLGVETHVVHGEVVCMLRRSESAQRFPGFLLGPGGRIDQGENPVLAAVREVQEETGLVIEFDEIQMKAVGIHHHLDRNEVWVNFIMRADIETFKENIYNTIEGSAHWIPIKQLTNYERVFPPSQFYFDHVLKDKPGVLHTNISWRDSQLVEILSQTLAK